ncbi:MAG: DNA recombination protein RmuC [Ignavibacteriae bacterium]|nr:MAG: DNA recombination protein RmuC [Ignavibacteriota bacterium]
MEIVLLIIIALILIVNLVILLKMYRIFNLGFFEELRSSISNLSSGFSNFEKTIKDEFQRNREEFNRNSRESREELLSSFKHFGDTVSGRMTEIANLQKNQLDTFSNQLTTLTRTNEDKIERMTQSNEQKMEKMRETLEAKLKAIQEDNSQQLEKMRQTVDEKLHKTLEQRLGESFKLVSERLELVHKGLGEMQTLATGVGDLKKVLANVKTRGILGEIQLGNILEQILSPEQYARDVVTKQGSRERVEYAIKLPGRDDTGQIVYLPIDSKFPMENYENLLNAYETANPTLIEEAAKLLEANIKKSAKDIKEKYIDPPNTTDFGILFLPIEGLYAEVVKRTSLLEILHREFKIVITGPTTLAAILNSLQMGFKTLAIEKRSSEVWKILGAVKTEFEKFGDVLKKAQEKINQASQDIDTLVGVRTRQIQKKLKDIQELPAQEIIELPDTTSEAEDE